MTTTGGGPVRPGRPRRADAGRRSVLALVLLVALASRALLPEQYVPFGVMGGFMQPQGHLQVVVNTVDYGMNPQAALDAPRWQWLEGKRIELEPEFDPQVAADLERRGHAVTVQPDAGSFGRGQIIWRDGDALIAAGESRTDGQALVY